jgi:hypothetical protein
MIGIQKSTAALAVATALFLAATATAHDPAQHGAMQHPGLKVLPKDIPHDRLIAVMQDFSKALGVKCTYCHVAEAGKMDFASEAKQEKHAARAMMLMVRKINEQDFEIKDWKDTKVTCYTCHRGAVKPLTEAPPPVPAAS